ncbi:MAG: hypothetical protein K0S93_819 [Nitrososphaeraceae archaeon]|nr:hypothetical protein [Nitrososphaeraceae archaeon]
MKNLFLVSLILLGIFSMTIIYNPFVYANADKTNATAATTTTAPTADKTNATAATTTTAPTADKTNATAATLPSSSSSSQKNKTTTTEEKPSSFNIAVAADWGCKENAKKTGENIQNKNPELVIANGDLSYKKSANCWMEIIQPLKSKMKVAMGDHEYSEITGGSEGIINQYLKPLNLAKTYYSFDMHNVHVTVIDPFIDYGSTSDQYQFIEQDLKSASANSKIDWIFVVESTPIYTSPSKHPANSTIRDIYHPLFDKYNIDLVFSSDNHNYQRTFPLKYNSDGDSSNNPIIVDRNQTKYQGDQPGQIFLITGTAGRSHYEIKEQAPFVVKQDDQHFGFLNIDINGKTIKGTFYANEPQSNNYQYVDYKNNIIDQFTVSK